MHIFEVDARQRITITALAERVQQIERWTTFDEAEMVEK